MSLPSSWLSPTGSSAVLFPFISLEGDLIPVADRPERVIYEGVDGIGLWFDGARGEPFTVKTICDFATQAAALGQFGAYKSWIGFALNLYFQSAFWGPVIVHDVTFNGAKKLGRTVGGINVLSGSSAVMLSATWKLETLLTS